MAHGAGVRGTQGFSPGGVSAYVGQDRTTGYSTAPKGQILAISTLAARLCLAALGLAACTETRGVLDDVVNPGATTAAESACMAEVNHINGGDGTQVVASSPDGDSSLVLLRDATDNGTWRCLASNDGVVRTLSFN